MVGVYYIREKMSRWFFSGIFSVPCEWFLRKKTEGGTAAPCRMYLSLVGAYPNALLFRVGDEVIAEHGVGNAH